MMTRTEMVDNLLDSYTKRELQALAERLGFGVARIAEMSVLELYDGVSNMLFDPACSYHEFNKLAEERTNVS